MKRGLIICAIFSLVTLPALTLAETHANHGGQAVMDPQMPHTGMEMEGKTIMLGDEQTVDGVKGMAHLKDVSTLMAKMGKKENYHFMMMFSDAKTGAAIEQGTVAVKIVDPKTGQAGVAIPLMGMGGHFGADIALSAKGEYQFQVGSKLVDGKKRQFTFKYTVQ